MDRCARSSSPDHRVSSGLRSSPAWARKAATAEALRRTPGTSLPSTPETAAGSGREIHRPSGCRPPARVGRARPVARRGRGGRVAPGWCAGRGGGRPCPRRAARRAVCAEARSSALPGARHGRHRRGRRARGRPRAGGAPVDHGPRRRRGRGARAFGARPPGGPLSRGSHACRPRGTHGGDRRRRSRHGRDGPGRGPVGARAAVPPVWCWRCPWARRRRSIRRDSASTTSSR